MRDDLNDRPHVRALRRCAYEELNLAIDQSGDELPRDWLREGDRDLESLRRLNEPEWQLIVRRQTGDARPEDPQFPGAAWGDPHRRRSEWLAVAVVFVALAVALAMALLPTEAWLGLAGLVAILAFVLIWTLARHRGLILGGLGAIAVVIYALTLVPRWLLIAAALVVASGAAYLMARRADAAAKLADARSIEERKRRAKKNLEPDEQRSKPDGPDRLIPS
jgi:hypothetical protein